MNSTGIEEQAACVARQFAVRHGRPPTWLVTAPGRVNLIGEHTDYNGGYVLPMAIDRYAMIAAGPVVEGDGVGPSEWLLSSEQIAEPLRFSTDEEVRRGLPAWGNYVRGVVAGFQARGALAGGVVGVLSSTVPLGGGLSSSAALEVAAATLVEEATGLRLQPREKALLCQRAEQEFTGVPCGIMDQFVSTMAEADALMLLDCRSCVAELVRFDAPHVRVLVTNTHVNHALTDGSYAMRREQCEAAASLLGVDLLREASLPQLETARTLMDPVLYRRARHVITEDRRTLAAVQSIRRGAWTDAGSAMYESHESLRSDFEVSCPELDLLVDLARSMGPEQGVLGSRMTGGGFGGCTVTLVCTGAVAAVAAEFRRVYKERTGIEPSIFVTRPSAGARVLKKGRDYFPELNRS